jgi:hypothetical protein
MGRGIEGTKIFRQDTVRVRDSGWVAKEIMRGEGLGESELRSGRRQRKVSRGEAFVLSVGGREDGISRGGGGAVSGCDHIGCASCGLFGGTARTPQVSVSTFGKNVPFTLYPPYPPRVFILFQRERSYGAGFSLVRTDIK